MDHRSKFIPYFLSLIILSCGVSADPEVTDAEEIPRSVSDDNAQDRIKVFRLKDGSELLGSPDGIEASMLDHLQGEHELSDTVWFTFDRLIFNDASSEINMKESEEQLENVARILRGISDSDFIIGGFFDKQGSTAEKMLLSQQRAQAVKNALVLRGVDGKGLKPEGYGPQGIQDGEEKMALALAGF